jgi:hypothetical protein
LVEEFCFLFIRCCGVLLCTTLSAAISSRNRRFVAEANCGGTLVVACGGISFWDADLGVWAVLAYIWLWVVELEFICF